MSAKKPKKRKYRFVRRLLRVLLGIAILFFLLYLFIRSPWGQNIIVDKATNYVSSKTNTTVEIDQAFITFDGNLKVEGLFLNDKKGDTLIYSKSLEANLPLWGLINGTALGVDDVKWNGLKANIIRKDTVSGYNFQFLIDAFATNSTTAVAKDSTTTSPEIVIGSLNLSAIDVVYIDIPLGIESRFKIGELETNMETVDVEKMVFSMNDLNLLNSNIKYIQKPVLITSTEEAPLPKLSAENIIIRNTKVYYKAEENNLLADLNLVDAEIENPNLNLQESIFKVDKFALRDSQTLVEIQSTSNSKLETTKSEFIWPAITLDVNEIEIENNSINYIVNNTKINKNAFDANAISLQDVNLKASTIFYKDKNAGLLIDTFNFNETSGINLEKLNLNVQLTDKNLDVTNLVVELNKNKLKANAIVSYSSFSQFMASPETAKLKVSLSSFNIFLKELFKIEPSLRNNKIINDLSKKPFTGNLYADGTFSSIEIFNSKVLWGNTTQIYLNGIVENITNPDKLSLNIPDFKAETIKKDVLTFIKEEDLGIQIPEKIYLTGTINGGLNDVATNLKLKSSQGTIALNGNFKNTNTIAFDADIKIEKYQLNQLLKNDQLGEISISVHTKGSGNMLNDLDADLNATVSDFKFKNYAIKDLNLQGKFKDGNGKLASTYKDENLNITLDALINLDTVNTKATATINLIGADLQGLGIMKRNVKTGMDISLEFNGNLNSYKVDADVTNGAVVYDNRTYLLGSIIANGFVDKDTTSITIKNKLIDLDLQSNTDPATFSKSIQEHISSYFYRDVVVTDTLKKPVDLKLKTKIAQTSLLSDVFLVNVKDIDTINISVDYNEANRKLDAKITAPHINYSGNKLDSLAFTMHTDKDNFNFKFGFKEILASPLNIPKTIITGNQTNNELSLNFAGYHKGETLMNVNTKITGNRDRLSFTVNPDSLILNKNKWNIPSDNEIVFTEGDKLLFTNFKIDKGNQSIEITDKLPNVAKNHIAIDYNNFKISEVFNYLNPDENLATGILNGDFVLEDPFYDTGIIANLNVSQFKVLNTDLGKLTMDAKSLGNNKYDFSAKLGEGDIDLNLTGDYSVINNDANLNLNLAINEFKMNALNSLSLGEIKETSGSFSGDFKVTGTTSNPKYNGEINFKDAVFNITKLNTKFTLQNEKLSVDNKGLSLNNFTVLDANKNALKLSGLIGTESFINPTFNLDLKANNFRVLNAKKEDNASLFGLATFNAKAKLTGDLQIPKLSANVTVGADTNLTYVLPATYANVENRDEVVAFVNRENPDAILTQTEEKTAIISGFDIKTILKIDKKATVTVVINEETGDNFKISGTGDFIFTMLPNGRITLTGGYEVADGHYELNLYNLVNRKFNLVPGSRITWSGDPFDADLNVTASYQIETSASPLMASQISNEDPSVKNKFKQVLPFNVYLNIDGELLKPKISFNLNMPEEDQGAIGGQVYGRVQQVNQQEEELNKQVFSLLVLNRFYPNSGSDGSTGGFATIARDNLNDAVSGQLNAFSDNLLGSSGIELDFDLNSYTDYQGASATDRTQLGVTAQKKIFNERLTVRVGSDVDIQGSSSTGETSPLIGNVSIEYKLSEDGRYRVKGFRKSEFENVIDGQTIVSGIALIFTQEFNEFNELWDAIFRAKEDEEEIKKAKKEAARKLKEKQAATNESIQKKKN